MEHESDGDSNSNWCVLYGHQKLVQRLYDQEIGEWVEAIQYYQDRPEYREESWRLEDTYYHSNFSENPSAFTNVKNSQKSKIIRPSDDADVKNSQRL